MTPDQYRREGAEAMQAAATYQADRAHHRYMAAKGRDPSQYLSEHSRTRDAIRAIDVDAVLAGLEPVTGGQSALEVCPICGIAGCRHIRMNRPAPEFDAAIFSDVEALYETDGQQPDPDAAPGSAECHDCGIPYGDPRFPDLVVPHDAWAKISPSGEHHGLLCPNCMCSRATAAKVECSAAFRSGPFSVGAPTPDATARLVAAARVFANWDHCWPGNINLEAACRDIRAALAAMEADHG